MEVFRKDDVKRMSFEIGCVLSRAVRADSRQRGARSQTLRVRNGRPAIDPDRDLDLLGEPSVTNIDLFIPGHGPGTLLLVFRTSFSYEKECEKPRALCPNNLANKKGERRPIFKFRFLLSFSLLHSGNYEMRYFNGLDANALFLGRLDVHRKQC